jgi:DNA-binding SARP family transcriptional activator
MSLGRFHGNNSYLTYRRWIRALDDAALAADPMLLVRLANVLQMMPGYVAEARAYAEQGARLAAGQGNTKVALLAQTNLAHWHYQQGNLKIGRQLIQAVLADPGCQDYPRLFALRIASLILSDAGYYSEVRPYYEQAIILAHEMNTRNEPLMNKANMAAKYWLPLGRIETAQQQLTEVLTHFAGSPGWMAQYLVYWCELQTVQGDWPGLAQTLNRIAETLADVETITIHSQVWLAHYQTVQAVMAGDEAQFQSALARYASLVEAIPLNQDCVAWLACWHWRRRGQWDDVRQRGQRALAQPTQYAGYRAQIALEMDIAQAMQHLDGGRDDFAIHEETRQFIHWRSRHQLLRLRALLAIVCRHRGDGRWRRHWTAVTRQLAKPSFTHLLTRRDPELGVRFWQIGLVENVDLDGATAVLTQIGQYEPLLPLLKHPKPPVRRRTAGILAQIGDERAMVGLTAVLADENHQATRQAIESAIVYLENRPPPPLTIRLMGDFSLKRGDEIIPAAAWHRPIVLRLFQYFAVNAGRPLAKEQILDDLWPDTDPAKAWTTFRTVYSRLRKLLEPAMRPKTANRYVSLNGDAYTFDPDGRADIDVQRFQQIVEDALQKRDERAVTAVPETLVAVLESYAPLLPDHPYAEWLLEPRQRLEALYVEGCLYLAQAYLVQGENGTAVTWARRTVTAAPWLEEAYQLLMRGYARQGQRSLALRVYAETAANLKRELDLGPSPLSQWLADTLRAGKSI